MPSILLIRHAQASFGSADYDVLSERGHDQAAALVRGLAERAIVPSRVVSGTLRRQLDTAAPCAVAHGLDVGVDPRWNEYDDRDILTHHSTAHVGLERRPGDQPISSREFQEILNAALRSWIAAADTGLGNEPWPAFRTRLTDALADVSASLDRGEVAIVVSSGGAIAALTSTLLGLPPDALITLNHVSINTGITKLTVGRGGTMVISVNEHAHLEGPDGSLVTYR
jgi:broad specificity phosphatase PhoE